MLKTGDDLITSKVAKSLGNIGGLAAFKALSLIKATPKSYLEKQVAFARALIAHRLNLDNDPMPFVKAAAGQPDAKDQVQALTLKPAQAKSVQTALGKLESGLFGMTPSSMIGFAVHSGKAKWMMFVNQQSEKQGISQSMCSRKLILGVLSRWIEETQTYDAQYAVLTQPLSSKSVQIMVIRSDGTVMYSGKAVAKDSVLSFAVSDTQRPGTSKTSVSGEFTEKGINLQAGITLFKRKGKRSPVALEMKVIQAMFDLERRSR
jgi:hypothetical protein